MSNPSLWLSVNQSSSYPTRSITPSEIPVPSDMVLQFKVPVSTFPSGYADTFTNPTVDEGAFYICTQVEYNAQGIPQSNLGGEILAIHRTTGEILWRNFMSTYSGVPGDSSRSSPLIVGDYLYFASGISAPQSITPYEDTLIGLFTGQPVVPTGVPPHLFCVSKIDGTFQWKTPLGPVCSNINDPGNWIYITESPVLVGPNLLAIGTSSGQSFQPWFYTNQQPFTGLSLGNQLNFQMTDIGTLFLIRIGDDGSFVSQSQVPMGPSLYIEGDTMTADSCPEGTSSALVRYVVQLSDVEEYGVLNPVQLPYANTSTITWVLQPGATVPTPLDLVTVINVNNQPVVLHAGDTIDTSLINVVVALEGEFVYNTNHLIVNSVQHDTNEPSTGLAGQTGLPPVRISKKLNVGDTLSSQDAYQLNFYGASIWGNTISYLPDRNALVLTTGQPHFFPYQESVNLNTGVPTFIESQTLIGIAQNNYIANPSETTYNAMIQAYEDYKLSIEYRFTIPRSERLKDFKFCSVVMISVAEETLGTILWKYNSTAYDYWQYGYNNLFSRSVANPYGFSSSQDYFERPVGPDGDYGQGVYFDTSRQKMVASSKHGFLTVFDLSFDIPLKIYNEIFGNAVINGASNYGSTLSNGVFMTIGTQAYYPNDVNLGAPSPLNFPPQLRWYVDPVQYYDTLQSYVFAFSLDTLTQIWNQPVLPQETTAPYGASLAQLSSTDSFVYIPTCVGYYSVRQITDGAIVGEFLLDGHGGQSGPALLSQELYAILGRSGLGNFFNLEGSLANYGPAQFVYKYIPLNYVAVSFDIVHPSANHVQFQNIQVVMTESYRETNFLSIARDVRLWVQRTNDSNTTVQSFQGGSWSLFQGNSNIWISSPVNSKIFLSSQLTNGKLQIGIYTQLFPRIPQYDFFAVPYANVSSGRQTIVLS